MKTIGTLLFTLSALGGLSGFSAPRCGATVYHSDGSEASVQACIRSAADGDIVTVPAGTFSWTSRLDITKGITLQGETTITGAGTSNPTINDATIIQDNTPRRGSATGIIVATMTPSQSFRLTGFTFAPGVSTIFPAGDGAFRLRSDGTAPNTSMRVDHCHFDMLYQGHIIANLGWVYGVADHNVIYPRGSSEAFFVSHASYGGPDQQWGNGSWADYPWYGTEKFFFIEDNTIIRSKLFAAIDTLYGSRYVCRHNYMQNATAAGHGTESGPHRGTRVVEVYNNTFYMTTGGGGGHRSGTCLWHDNTFTGTEANNDHHSTLSNYRQTPARAFPVWGIADGTSPWDVNDTEGNGTSVEGHPPFLFDSGTDTSSVNSQGVIHDSTKNWTPNQWVGYSIKNTNPASASYGLGSYVKSNTSNTITYSYSPGPQAHLIFNAGDTYEIHRVLVMMDQNGRGKGDLVRGHRQPINTTAGRRLWTHQALEPCYSWNNIYTPNGHALGFGSGSPTTIANRDYYNLGGGFAADTTPSAVSSRYTAALNGVDYTGTFVYPHPLVTAAPTPTPNATPKSQQHLQKKEAKKAKKLKRRKGGQNKIGK